MPNAPTVNSSGISTITLQVNNNSTLPNPSNTEYAIYEVTTSQYVQTDNRLGTGGAVWKTLSGWGTGGVVVISGLSASTNYQFQTKARNASGFETSFSPVTNAATQGAYPLPFVENFTSSTFPPAEWSILQNPVDTYTWQWQSQGMADPGAAFIPFWNYWSPTYGEQDHLITPPITTLGVTSGLLSFHWSYNPNYGYNDALDVWYSTDGCTTKTIFWSRSGANLVAGNNGPSAIATSNWGVANISLPAGACNQPTVLFGFRGTNGYGPNLYLDNITIQPMNEPYINFAPFPLTWGNPPILEGQNRNVQINNNSGAPLVITSVTPSNPNVVTSWSSQTIPANSNTTMTVTWTPTSISEQPGSILFQSNAQNGPQNTLTLTGNGVLGEFQNLTFNPPRGPVGSTTTFSGRYHTNAPDVNFTSGTLQFDGTNYPMTLQDDPFSHDILFQALNLPFNHLGPHSFDVSLYYTYQGNSTYTSHTDPFGFPVGVPPQQGGPDGGGYYYATSDVPNGPSPNFEDISSTGNLLPLSGDDAVAQRPLGSFEFPFYGNTVNQSVGLWASTNGNLQVGSSAFTAYTNTNLPTTSLNSGAIAPWWDDHWVYPNAGHGIYYQNMGDGRYIVQFNTDRLGNYGSEKYQVVLHNNGNIDFKYGPRTSTSSSTATIGIQGSQSGTQFTQ
ncbi:MAG: choice-of-anchor J domain-containing protein, partial [bacterium]|nr:choice-of-anchor J domain-containing protein [bacterium]